MTQAGVFHDIDAGACTLVARLRVRAAVAGVPHGDIVATSETVVVIVVELVIVEGGWSWRCCCDAASCEWGRWYQKRGGRIGIDVGVALAPSITSPIVAVVTCIGAHWGSIGYLLHGLIIGIVCHL